MMLEELIEELRALVEADPKNGEAEVRIAYQPMWPLAGDLDAVTLESEAPPRNRWRSFSGRVLWLAAGAVPSGENPYAPKIAWDGGEVDSDDDPDSE